MSKFQTAVLCFVMLIGSVYAISRMTLSTEKSVPAIDGLVSAHKPWVIDRHDLIVTTIGVLDVWRATGSHAASFTFKKGDLIPPVGMLPAANTTGNAVVIWTDTNHQKPESGCWKGIKGLYEEDRIRVQTFTADEPSWTVKKIADEVSKSSDMGWGLYKFKDPTRRCVAASDGAGGIFRDYPESTNTN